MTHNRLAIAGFLAFGLIALVVSSGIARAGSTPIAAGSKHTCAVTPTGGVKCWGANDHGQLGNNSNAPAMTPVNVSGLSSGVASVAGGAAFSCALTNAGAVKCWGRNNAGQLGDGTNTERTTPVQVSGLTSGVTAIAAGQAHACALLNTGGVKCWGSKSNGQLGDGDETGTSTTPVDANLPEGATAIAASALFTCAITPAGGVKCWGDNAYGQVGDGTIDNRPTPTQVTGLTSGVSGIGLGGGVSFGHACAAMAAGGAKCWGNNEYGQLGDDRLECDPRPPLSEICSTPLDVLDISVHLRAIAGGGLFTCAVTDGGAAKCWGHNSLGELGDNFACGGLCGTPQNVAGLSSGVTSIATGSSHACATLATGVMCWGDNGNGQLGDAGKCGTSCVSPVDVVGLGGGTNGDVNCDQSVNSIDAALVLQLSAGLLSSVACSAAADVNHDGRVNSIDAALILQFSAGLLATLP